MISEAFLLATYAFRARGGRLYRLALDAKMTPPELSAILHGARPIRSGDPRIIKVGAALGLDPSQCFAPEAEEQVAS